MEISTIRKLRWAGVGYGGPGGGEKFRKGVRNEGLLTGNGRASGGGAGGHHEDDGHSSDEWALLYAHPRVRSCPGLALTEHSIQFHLRNVH